MLAADEAFLMIVPTPRGTHSLVVTREGIDWHRSTMTEAELAGHVRRLLWDVGANIDVMPEEDERWSAEGEGDFPFRSEEHTSELQSLMRISYAVFCLKKKKNQV